MDPDNVHENEATNVLTTGLSNKITPWYRIKMLHVAEFSVKKPVADPRGLQGRVPSPGPNSFIFMQFLAKILQNNRFEHPLGIWRPLGNAGSATGNRHYFTKMITSQPVHSRDSEVVT